MFKESSVLYFLLLKYLHFNASTREQSCLNSRHDESGNSGCVCYVSTQKGQTGLPNYITAGKKLIIPVWTPAYTPTDRLTSWDVLIHPCTVPVYKLLFIKQ
jgi:hypothetical protein